MAQGAAGARAKIAEWIGFNVFPCGSMRVRFLDSTVGEAAVELDERLTGEIVRRILGVARPERIILFGSASKGRMTRESDIDLLVLKAAPGPGSREEYVRIRDALRGLGCPFDVIVMTTERFYESRGVIGAIAYPADKYGKVIYEAA